MNFRPQFIDKKEKKPISNYLTTGANEPVTKHMSVDHITFREDQRVAAAIDILLAKKITEAPVLDEHGELVGMLSEKDCLRVVLDRIFNNLPANTTLVRDAMDRNIPTISIHRTVVDAAQMFINSNIRKFPVVDDDEKFVGHITRKDILRAARNLKSASW